MSVHLNWIESFARNEYFQAYGKGGRQVHLDINALSVHASASRFTIFFSLSKWTKLLPSSEVFSTVTFKQEIQLALDRLKTVHYVEQWNLEDQNL